MRFFQVGAVVLGWFGYSLITLAASQQTVVSKVLVESTEASHWQVTGQAVSRYQLPLSFRVGGQVANRQVEVGDRVEANQKLASLDASDLQLALEQSQANLASAQSRLDNASRERKRLNKLYNNKLISLQDLQRAETFEVESQQAVVAAEATLKLATNQRKYSELHAPQAGQVAQVNIETGQWVGTGQTAFELLAGATEAEVFLPAHALDKNIQTAVLSSVDQPIQCQAKLRTKNPVSNKVTRQVSARYQLSDCTAPLDYGSVIRLTFEDAAVANQLQVPVTAVFNQGHQAYVWQLVEGVVQASPVKVISINHQFATLTSAALAVGDKVVLQGTHRLVAGQAVSVLK